MKKVIVHALLALGIAVALTGAADSYAQLITVDSVTLTETGATFEISNNEDTPTTVGISDLNFDHVIELQTVDNQITITVPNMTQDYAYYILSAKNAESIFDDGTFTRVYVHPSTGTYPFIADLNVYPGSNQFAFGRHAQTIYWKILNPDMTILNEGRSNASSGFYHFEAVSFSQNGVHRITISTDPNFARSDNIYYEYVRPNNLPFGQSFLKNDSPFNYVNPNLPPAIAERFGGTPEIPLLFPFEQMRNIRVDVRNPDPANIDNLDPDDDITVTTDRKESVVTIDDEKPGRFNIEFTAGVQDYNVDTINITATDSGGLTDTAEMYYQITQINEFASPAFTISVGRHLDMNITSHVATDPNAEVNVTAVSKVRLGQAERLDGQTVRYTAGNQTGADSVLIKAEVDGTNRTVLASVMILANVPPAAGNTSETVAAGQTIDIDLSGIVSDPDDDPLTVSVPDAPALGTVTVAGTTVSYAAGTETGTDTVRYQVDDGRGGMANGTITITITPANRAPVLAPIADINADEGQTIRIRPAASDADAGDTLTWTLDRGTLPEAATFDANTGALDWTTTEQDGGASHEINITVSDGNGGSDSETITITVTETNQNPAFDSIATEQSATVGVPFALDVTATDADAPAQTITYEIASHDATGAQPAINPNNGTISWTPDTAGTVSITVRASDDQTPAGTADITLVVTVSGVPNVPPVAPDEMHTVQEDTATTITPGIMDDGTFTIAMVTNGTRGTAAVDGATITYTPGANENGQDTITYTVRDDDGAETTGTITITITPVNDAPELDAIDDITVDEGGPVEIRPTATDIEDDTLTYGIERGDLPAAATFDTATGALDWTATESDGGASYDITITVSDGNGGSDSETITITVTETNQSPVFDDTITERGAAPGDLLAHDVTATDPDVPAQTITYEITSHNATGTPPAINPSNGTISWTPDTAETVSITVRASDDWTPAGTADITLTVTVAEIVAIDDAATSNKIDALHIHATANDAPADARITELNLTQSRQSYPDLGAITHNGTHITYEPSAEDIGIPDGAEISFRYTLTSQDGALQTQAAVTITLRADPVEAVDDAASTAQNTPVEIDVLTNDIYNRNRSPVVPLVVDSPEHGTVELTAASGVLRYTPETDYAGTDTFVYEISDPISGNSDNATVTVTIASTNMNPVFDSIVTEQSTFVGEPFTLDVTATDADTPAQTITYEIASHDATGAPPAIDPVTGTISWTPDTAEIVSITVRASDDQTPAGTADITITVTVSPAPPEPVLRAPDIDIEAVPGSLTSVRPDIGAGTIESATGAEKGTITEGFLAQGTIAYTAGADESGIDTVTYTVSDGAEDTAQGTIYFYINAQGNERPMLEAMPGIQTDDTATFQATATDGNNDTLTYVIRNAPAGTAMDSVTGAFSWNSTGSSPGDYIFNVIVHDDTGGLDLQKMVVTVRDPNNGSPTAPVVHRSTTLGTSVLIAPDIRDPEGQPTGMILAVGAEKGTIREGFLEANIIAYVPTEEGTDIISYTTSDGAGGATTSIVYIHTGTSDDPDLEAIGVQRVNTTEILEFQTPISDEDSSDISYVMSGAPDGATLDESTGGFSWTPAASDVGDHAFTITAYDGQGGFDTEHVAISVSDPNVTNHDPDISDLDFAARQNNPRFIALQTSDPDGDPTEIMLATNATAGAILQDSLRFGIVAYVPDIDRVGTDEIIYVVSDGRGGASTGTIYVHVKDPDNDEPTLDSIGIKRVDILDALVFDVTATDNNADDTLTYDIRNAPAGATINSVTGAFSWTPTASDMGDHAFTVVVRDDAGGFATERIIVTVTDPTSQNQNPTASDESVTTAGERISILPDIDDPDGDDITIIAATGTIQGLVDPELLGDAIIAYTPFEGAFGTETITYTVSDGHGGLATGTITITIG